MKPFWKRIIQFFEPSHTLTDPLERQQATILINLLLFFMVTSTIIFIGFDFLHVSNRTGTRPTIIPIVGVLQYLPLIYFSRTRYYRVIGNLFIAASTLLILYSLVSNPTASLDVLNYLNVFLVVCGLVLSARAIIIYMAIFISIVWLFPYIKPDPNFSPIDASALLISMATGMTILSETTRRFKKELMQSEKVYRDLMDANSEGILVLHNETELIIDANQAIETIMGHTREEFMGHNALEYLVGESKRTAAIQWAKRSTQPVELNALRKDGSIINIMATLKSHTYKGEPCFIVRVLDITAQKRIENALRETEQRARIIFNESDQLIGVINPDGKIIEANDTTYRFYGLKPTDLLGKYLWEINHWSPDERTIQFIQNAIQKVSQGEAIRSDVKVRNAMGDISFLDLTIKPVFDTDQQVSLIIAEASDITARRLAEQQGFEFQRRYEALFTSTTDAVVITGLDNILIGANQRALHIFRCQDLSEIVGHPATKFIADDETYNMELMRQRLNDPNYVPDLYEREMRRSNGERFVAEMSVMMVRDTDNNPLYIQTMVRDTSDRRRQERQQFELALQREKTKLLQHFIDEASHHFRTPITNIKTSIYLLQKTKAQPEKQEQHYLALNSELQRLDNLLNDLLTVTRLQKDDSQFRIGNISISQLLMEVRSRFEGNDNYPNHQWEWQLHPEDLIVIGDKHHMARALMNLIDNAVRYTPAQGRIYIRSIVREQWLVIEIVDSGIGISEADMPYIFEDFYRGADAQATDSTSSGLGLSITKQIIERHRGHIAYKSHLGEGTSVKVILPINTPWYDNLPDLPQDILAQLPSLQH